MTDPSAISVMIRRHQRCALRSAPLSRRSPARFAPPATGGGPLDRSEPPKRIWCIPTGAPHATRRRVRPAAVSSGQERSARRSGFRRERRLDSLAGHGCACGKAASSCSRCSRARRILTRGGLRPSISSRPQAGCVDPKRRLLPLEVRHDPCRGARFVRTSPEVRAVDPPPDDDVSFAVALE